MLKTTTDISPEAMQQLDATVECPRQVAEMMDALSSAAADISTSVHDLGSRLTSVLSEPVVNEVPKDEKEPPLPNLCEFADRIREEGIRLKTIKAELDSILGRLEL